MFKRVSGALAAFYAGDHVWHCINQLGNIVILE
jgi:hypothetical protein